MDRQPRTGRDAGLLAAAAPDARSPVLFVAVVHTVNDVCFTAAAATRPELTERVAEYVRRHAREQLWPGGASEVQTLLDGGELEAAVERYFALVGDRWDEEWLVTAAVDAATLSVVQAVLDRTVPALQPDGSRSEMPTVGRSGGGRPTCQAACRASPP
jgi:hypothetical protein